MKSLLILAAAAIGLSACTHTGSIDTAIRQSLPQICSAADTGHAVFVAIAATGKIKPSTVAKEEAAYGQLVVVCANKDTATLASTLVSAATAYAVITAALKEAQNVEG
ncbi:cell wall anchor protein [Neorhizobium sp. T786]|uniref:cell wall anchor protein n=1 Tax=Pseudorhizobium xiangyangii TaxID=2883104 RepID=UPI001D000467|nr:cell wall anchor protein [Neorhizobium xiangyangii]MCB5204998.1 cell wall anchor protein [Neorhizobium xiangyangii]